MTQANDSILVTPGTGATVATHLAASKEYQAIMEADSRGHIKGTLPLYVASYKLATDAAASALAFTHVANTDKQYATIYHTAAATKTVRLRRVELFIAATAATILNVELRYLNATTAPATGNPAITPRQVNPADAAAESTCLALPTTGGSFPAAVPLFTQEMNLGANTAQTTNFPIDPVSLWPGEGFGDFDTMQDLSMRGGVAEGYAISLRAVAAVALKATVRIIFTEE